MRTVELLNKKDYTVHIQLIIFCLFNQDRYSGYGG